MASEINFTDLANFQPRQLEAFHTLFQDNCKYLLYGGAAGGGKSYFLRWAAAALGMYYSSKYAIKGVPIGLFSADYPTLKDRQVKMIKREFPEWLGQIKETRDEGYVFQSHDRWGGWQIMLRNLDDPSKYKSVEFAAILVEELTENPRETFDDLRFRLRFPGISDPKFVGATNPGGIGHGFVKRLWVVPDPEETDPEKHLFKFVSAQYSDNSYIDASYEQQLDALPPDKRRAYKEGDWNVFAGQSFGEFRTHLHVCRPFVPKKELIKFGGMDWGRTAPFAFLASALDIVQLEDGRKFHRMWTYKEVYGTEKTPKEWAEVIKRTVNLDEFAWIRGDPAMFTKGQDMSISIADQFKAEDVRIKPASNDRIGGWTVLHDWLSLAPDGLPYWLITENCSNLIRTLPELIHDENRVEDVDTDSEDHAPDAMRYLLKHVKWIDAKSGGVKPPEPLKKTAQGPLMRLDLDKFAVSRRPGRSYRPV